ncbi:hypothetical protein NKG05_02740 [Oerskovia sp. M15]
MLGAGELRDVARTVLERAEYLTQRYHVAVANPPYMGGANMNGALAAFARDRFSGSKSDLFAMFIERCIGLTVQHGMTAMITMQSWMFISSYEALRETVVAKSPPSSMLHLGERGFDSIDGSVVSTTAFVLERGSDSGRRTVYVRAVDGENEAAKRDALLVAINYPVCEWRFVASAADFAKVPGAPIAYWLSDAMRSVFANGRALGDLAAVRTGMNTGTISGSFDCGGKRRGRLFALVQHRRRMHTLPTIDGSLTTKGAFRKWWGNQEVVLRFDAAHYDVLRASANHLPSRQYYFKPSVSWSKVSSGAPAFRYYPSGFAFDGAGNSLFATTDKERLFSSES